jgi:ribonuclease HI
VLNPSHGLAVFSDGSWSWKDMTGGWAWVAIDHLDNEVSDSGSVPNTRIGAMELTACVEALTSIFKLCGSSDLLVYCDSEYVVRGNKDRTRALKKNSKLWRRLDKAIACHGYVEWNHVRGHGDSYYNDLADKLAGSARKELASACTPSRT